MNRRNWLQLARKLVDQFDMTYSEDSTESSINAYAEDYFGFGVAQTPAYPNGLALTLSNAGMNVSVSPGVAIDPLGNRIKSTGTVVLAIPASDPVLARKDLVIARYKKTGTTPVPKPSDPITTIFLDLVDDFDLLYLPGAPNAVPAYPATLTNDVILYGVFVPANAVLGTTCSLDQTVRMFAVPSASRLLRRLGVTGATDGINQTFVLSQAPCDPLSCYPVKNGIPLDEGTFTVVGNILTIELASTPVAGETLAVLALVGQTGAMAQGANTVPGGQMTVEVATGLVDGFNQDFSIQHLPIDPLSAAVFLGAGPLLPTEYTIVAQTLHFNPGSQPAFGQKPVVVYLRGSVAIVGLVGSGGGGMNAHVPFYHKLTAPDITAKAITLPYTPVDPTRIVLDTPSGAPQIYGVDYTIVGNQLTWTGLGLDGIETVNDYWRVIEVGAGTHAPFYRKLTAPDITAKAITLPYTPADATRIILDTPNGTPQVLGVDYTIVGNQLTWGGLGLDGVETVNDYWRIIEVL